MVAAGPTRMVTRVAPASDRRTAARGGRVALGGAMGEKQRRMLAFIQAYTKAYGWPPTLREIGAAVGMASTSAVNYRLRQMEEAGLLSRWPNASRAVRLTEAGVAALGG